MTPQEVAMTKDRDLLARVAVHSPHVAGTMLRLLNDLEVAARLGELPPAPVLDALGAYVEGIGRLIASLADSMNRRTFLADVNQDAPSAQRKGRTHRHDDSKSSSNVEQNFPKNLTV